MLFKRPSKNRQERRYKNMNWLIVLLVIIVAMNYHSTNRLSALRLAKNTANQATGTSNIASLTIPTQQDVELFTRRLFPNPADHQVTIQDLQFGAGAPAVCGQQVKLVYQAYDEKGSMFNDSANVKNPLTFTIGKHTVIPAFEQGVIGLRPEGVRNIFAPAKLAYDAKGFTNDNIPANSKVRFEVKLLSAAPAITAPESSSFRFFDTRKGIGTAIRCGEKIKAHITIWDTQGKKIYTSHDVGSKPITITPGSGTQFLGLEHAAIDMRPGMARTVIVPPDFQKIWHKNADTLPITFPKNQTVLVDIETPRE